MCVVLPFKCLAATLAIQDDELPDCDCLMQNKRSANTNIHIHEPTLKAGEGNEHDFIRANAIKKNLYVF